MSSKDFVGPSCWQVLHSFAAAYSPEQRDSFVAFVDSFSALFPCHICRKNLEKKRKLLPIEPYLDNNHDLFFWTYIIHDMVNSAITGSDPSNAKTSPCYDTIKYVYFDAMGNHCDDCNI